VTLRSVAVVHGAVSIVNAVATGFGSALGISLKVEVEMVAEKGSGIIFESGNSNKMIDRIIEEVLSPKFITEYLLPEPQLPVHMMILLRVTMVGLLLLIITIGKY
jgi:hypothetical protein